MKKLTVDQRTRRLKQRHQNVSEATLRAILNRKLFACDHFTDNRSVLNFLPNPSIHSFLQYLKQFL